MIAALILFAAIVSDNAKEFFKGGDWLPDAVPNAAIYDSTNVVEKELRLTTNVCAAVLSCYSGLFERKVIGGGEVVWDGEDWTPDYSVDLLKTNRFEINSLGTNYYRQGVIAKTLLDSSALQTNVASYRVIGLGDLLACREILRDVADGRVEHEGVGNPDEWFVYKESDGVQWSDCIHESDEYKWPRNSVVWGSSKLNGREFPVWDWTNEVLAEDMFCEVWPQYTSCAADGVWRTQQKIMRGALSDAVSFFDILGDPFNAEEIEANIYKSATSNTCYGILTDRLGDSAAHFADDTPRLDYYRLGSIETAIASMDTAYTTEEPTHNDWNVEHRGYSHEKGKSCQVSPAAVAVDLDKMTASLSCDFDLEYFETWTTTTNTSWQTRDPEFACHGDTASGSVVINGSCPVFVTYEAVSNALAEVSVGAETLWGDFTANFSAGGVEFVRDATTVTCPVSNGTWTVSAVDSVTRIASVWYTTDLMKTIGEAVGYPVPLAWARGMVKDRLNALEWRCSNTNFNVETDSGGAIWCSFDEPEAAQHRSVYVGEYATTNAFLTGWRNARTAHRDAVGAYSIANVGCSLKNREALIPIGDDAVNHVVAAMPKQLTASVGYHPRNGQIDTYIEEAGCITFYIHDTGEYAKVYPGGMYQLGYLHFTYEIPVSVDSYFTLRPDRYTTGDIAPAQRIRWKFENLHEE